MFSSSSPPCSPPLPSPLPQHTPRAIGTSARHATHGQRLKTCSKECNDIGPAANKTFLAF